MNSNSGAKAKFFALQGSQPPPMESAAIAGARWVLDKALNPLSGGLVEAWAATTELEPNIEALKAELLSAQGILHRARGVEIDNPALTVLLQKLRDLGYEADNALDELDYFRIQDEIDGSVKAVDDRGCVRNLASVVRHAARQLSCDKESCECVRRLTSGACSTAHAASAAAKHFCCASCLPTARGSDKESDEDTDKCGRRLASRARTAARALGTRFLCSSPLSVGDDSKHGKHAPRVPKLKFDRVDV
jgi:hypothetical protein